jgi:hypothetical protein
MNSRYVGILVALFLLGPLVGTRGTAACAGGGLRRLKGTLTQVGTNSVTAAGRIFQVSHDTLIDIHGHAAELTDLTAFVGGPVRVTFFRLRARLLATKIQVLPDVPLGFLAGWVVECETLPDGSVHIVVEDDHDDFDLFLVNESEVDINAAGLFFAAGDVADTDLLCDLVGGAFVEAEFDADTGDIVDVNVEVELDSAVGRVVDVDPAAATLTIATFRFGVLDFQTLPATALLDHGTPIGLGDLKPGNRVRVIGFATESDVLFATQMFLLRH